jgi:hypothetical protein
MEIFVIWFEKCFSKILKSYELSVGKSWFVQVLH